MYQNYVKLRHVVILYQFPRKKNTDYNIGEGIGIGVQDAYIYMYTYIYKYTYKRNTVRGPRPRPMYSMSCCMFSSYVRVNLDAFLWGLYLEILDNISRNFM